MTINSGAIPVVMYHTVSRIIPEWKWSFLTVPVDIFVDQLKWLDKYNYRTIDIYELIAHVKGESPLPARSVFLTFDDGYLDNWTYVAPYLERFGFKATVFVNPEFVDPRDIVRSTVEQVWAGETQEEELEIRGFMSWPELKLLSDKGIFNVQSHGMSHTWYPASDEIIDFYKPGDNYYWLGWNTAPMSKPFYLDNLETTTVPWGTPVYAHGKSLAVRRYFPDVRETQMITDYVKLNDSEQFFNRPDWKTELFEKSRQLRKEFTFSGKMETRDDHLKRLSFEFKESRRIIEEKISAVADYLCWPGGGYTDLSQKVALENYTAVTLGSSDQSDARNRPGDNPLLTKRIGVPGIEYSGRMHYLGGRYFVKLLEEYQGSLFARKYRQVLKAMKIILIAAKEKIQELSSLT